MNFENMTRFKTQSVLHRSRREKHIRTQHESSYKLHFLSVILLEKCRICIPNFLIYSGHRSTPIKKCLYKKKYYSLKVVNKKCSL